MDVLNIRHHRHFCNKIWQATRFFFHHYNARGFEYHHPVGDRSVEHRLSEEDVEVLRLYGTMVNDCNTAFEGFRLHHATMAIHNFFWFQLCAVYLEHTKPFLNNLDSPERDVKLSVLLYCLEGSMRSLHPFMPFLTEELWQRLKELLPGDGECDSICLADYPKMDS